MKASTRRRGLYILPTLFTLGNLAGGCAAILLTSRGDYFNAALAIVIAGFLDGMDGRVARLAGTDSDFGREFDSLADIVSFGVAPAFLTMQWAMQPLGRFGWSVAFLFIACAATRLARFNIMAVRADARYFAGLPSPPAGGTLAAVVFAFPRSGRSPRWPGPRRRSSPRWRS